MFLNLGFIDKFVGVHAHPETGNNIVAICAYGIFPVILSFPLSELKTAKPQSLQLYTNWSLEDHKARIC